MAMDLLDEKPGASGDDQSGYCSREEDPEMGAVSVSLAEVHSEDRGREVKGYVDEREDCGCDFV